MCSPDTVGVHWYPTEKPLAHLRRRMEGGDDMHARLCGMFSPAVPWDALYWSSDSLPTPLPLQKQHPCCLCLGPHPHLEHALHQRLIKTSKHPAVSSTSPCFISQLCSQNHHRCIAADLPAHPFSARSSDRSIPYQAEA